MVWKKNQTPSNSTAFKKINKNRYWILTLNKKISANRVRIPNFKRSKLWKSWKERIIQQDLWCSWIKFSQYSKTTGDIQMHQRSSWKQPRKGKEDFRNIRKFRWCCETENFKEKEFLLWIKKSCLSEKLINSSDRKFGDEKMGRCSWSFW